MGFSSRLALLLALGLTGVTMAGENPAEAQIRKTDRSPAPSFDGALGWINTDKPLKIEDLKGKVVLCLGGEEKGLRSRTRQLCDRMIGLPMRGRVGSLNIATAAAAVLYEAVRQRSRP